MYLSVVKNPFRMMKNPEMFFHFYCVNLIKIAVAKCLSCNICLEHAQKRKYALRRPFLHNEEFNEQLKKKILSNKPFFCCRYGNSELTACFYAQLRENGLTSAISEKHLKTAKSGPGVFPEKEDMYLEFSKVYYNALESADFNAYWGSVLMEEYLLSKILSDNCAQMAMRALEPFQYDVPWTVALTGKKVLVVHPFANLIAEQYKRRNEIFPEGKILPDFQLVTVAAVQSSGETVPEEYSNWIEALEALYEKCCTMDFDVALIACGSYAVPLAAKLKECGKQSIVLGGMMQLMFGIKGARWEKSRPDIVALYNDAWVRADESLRVKDADKMVDGPAYW